MEQPEFKKQPEAREAQPESAENQAENLREQLTEIGREVNKTYDVLKKIAQQAIDEGVFDKKEREKAFENRALLHTIGTDIENVLKSDNPTSRDYDRVTHMLGIVANNIVELEDRFQERAELRREGKEMSQELMGGSGKKLAQEVAEKVEPSNEMPSETEVEKGRQMAAEMINPEDVKKGMESAPEEKKDSGTEELLVNPKEITEGIESQISENPLGASAENIEKPSEEDQG